jgi:tetratricopeptide (TPR) repeat protein
MEDEAFRLFNAGVTASMTASQWREQGAADQAGVFDQQAIAAFDKVLAIQPRHSGALSGKALSLAQLGRTREALEWFRRAAEADPAFPEHQRQLGLCHAELGDVEAARTATLRALELDKCDEYREQAAIELSNFGGHALAKAADHRDQGEKADEQRYYRQAQGLFSLSLEIDPDNPEARRGLRDAQDCLAGRPPSRKPWWRFW